MISRLPVALLATALLFGCAAQPDRQESRTSDAPAIVLSGEDDVQATKRLLAFLTENRMKAEALDEDTLQLSRDGGNYIIQPKLTIDTIDRLVVTKPYEVREGHRGSIEMLALVVSMNRRFNIGQFSLSENGDTLFVQSNYTFDDRLTTDDLNKFLAWLDNGITAMLSAMPELSDYLE